MNRAMICRLFFGTLFSAVAAMAVADEAKEEAIKNDRQRIEGTWKVVAVVVNGKEAAAEEVGKLTVVNGSDGGWNVRSNGSEISMGGSTIDPTKNPKTIDFTPTAGGGEGEQHQGIYELGKNTRTLCFAPPGGQRPTDFTSKPGSGHVLVTFERVKPQ